jgi:hypothetical protein
MREDNASPARTNAVAANIGIRLVWGSPFASLL